MADNEEVWFAVRTRAKHEIKTKDFFQKIDTSCYLATRTLIRRYANYRTKKVETPVISNLLFVRSTKVKIISILNEYGSLFSLIRNKSQQVITVPDKQMENFIQVMEAMKEEVSVDVDTFASGDKVRVIDGPLAGVEGDLIKREGRHHLVVRLPEITTVSVKVPKRMVEKIVASPRLSPTEKGKDAKR